MYGLQLFTYYTHTRHSNLYVYMYTTVYGYTYNIISNVLVIQVIGAAVEVGSRRGLWMCIKLDRLVAAT